MNIPVVSQSVAPYVWWRHFTPLISTAVAFFRSLPIICVATWVAKSALSLVAGHLYYLYSKAARRLGTRVVLERQRRKTIDDVSNIDEKSDGYLDDLIEIKSQNPSSRIKS